MTTQTPGIDEATRYAARIEVPMELINQEDDQTIAPKVEKLIRTMLRNAYQAGMIGGLQAASDLVKGAAYQRSREEQNQ